MRTINQRLLELVKEASVYYHSLDITACKSKIDDIVKHDMLAGDWWIMVVGEHDIELVLGKPKEVSYLVSHCDDKSACYKIGISEGDEFSISRISLNELKSDKDFSKVNNYRKSNRLLARNILSKLAPELFNHDILKAWTEGVLYINTDNNSVSYFIVKNGAGRAIPVTFSLDRPVQCYKLEMISKYGHATIDVVPRSQYQKAIKRLKAA